MDSGIEQVGDVAAAAAARRQSTKVVVQSLLLAGVLTGLCFVL